MPPRKDVKGFGMPWEDQYGYAQAVRVDDTIYVSGQLRAYAKTTAHSESYLDQIHGFGCNLVGCGENYLCPCNYWLLHHTPHRPFES